MRHNENVAAQHVCSSTLLKKPRQQRSASRRKRGAENRPPTTNISTGRQVKEPVRDMERLPVCSVCGQRFAALGRAVRHEVEECSFLGRSHLLKTKVVQCAECEKSFGSRSRLQQHVRLAHGSKIPAADRGRPSERGGDKESEKSVFLKVSWHLFNIFCSHLYLLAESTTGIFIRTESVINERWYLTSISAGSGSRRVSLKFALPTSCVYQLSFTGFYCACVFDHHALLEKQNKFVCRSFKKFNYFHPKPNMYR